MKKFALLTLTLALLLTLSACATVCPEPPPEEPPAPTDQPTDAPEPQDDWENKKPHAEEIITDIEQLGKSRNPIALYYFLRSDAQSLSKLFYMEEYVDLFAPLESLRFSSFKLTKNEGESTSNFDFTVSESNWDRFPVGDYSYTVGPLTSTMWDDNTLPSLYATYPLPWLVADTGCVDDFAFERGILDIDYDLAIFVSILKAEVFIEAEGEGVTLDRAREAAKALFGIDNYVPQIPRTCAPHWIDETRYMTRTLGSRAVANQFTDITDDGTNLKFICRTYADPMYLIPVGVYEYHFARADNDYGWTLMSVKRLEKNDLDAWYFST